MSAMLKEVKLFKPKEKYLNKETKGTMITNIELKDINNIPLSRTTTNHIEISIPVKVVYKIYKPNDIIIRELNIDDIEKRVFVILKVIS